MTALPHPPIDDHTRSGQGGPSSPDRAKGVPQPKPATLDLGTETPPGEAITPPMPVGAASRPADALLRIYADTLNDLEQTRIATENRIRALIDEGGQDAPETASLQGLKDGIKTLEHGVELNLKRAMRTHPLGPWVKATVGVGEKQAARLLAVIGDPAWNTRDDRPRRGPAELWAYCGLHVVHPSGPAAGAAHTPNAAGMPPVHSGDHRPNEVQAPTVSGVAPNVPSGQRSADTHTSCAAGAPVHLRDHGPLDAHAAHVPGVAPSRRRGQRANWSTEAKTRTYLVAESCIKQATSPYRPVYDQGRAKYADALHPAPCPRCGPSGKPALAGSPLSAGHQHARAMRLVMKAILLDLWREARRHQEGE